MSWLGTLFILELIGVRLPTDLSGSQAFLNVSLQMMIDKTFIFRPIFHKKLHRIQVFDARYEWPKWKRCPFTSSSFAF